MIDQSNAKLKEAVGLGGNLCGPAAAAHLLAGYDDHPNKPSNSDAATAGYNDVDLKKFGSIIKKQGLLMGTNRTTIDIDLVTHRPRDQDEGDDGLEHRGARRKSLANSFYSFGSRRLAGDPADHLLVVLLVASSLRTSPSTPWPSPSALTRSPRARAIRAATSTTTSRRRTS